MASADNAAERTACKSSQRLAKCRYAALGTTPARLVASRSTTASGPPERASWIPASSSARRRSPWRYVLRSGGLVVASVTILYVDIVHFGRYSIVDGVHKAVYHNPEEEKRCKSSPICSSTAVARRRPISIAA